MNETYSIPQYLPSGRGVGEMMRADRFNYPIERTEEVREHLSRNITPLVVPPVPVQPLFGDIISAAEARAQGYVKNPKNQLADLYNNYYVRIRVPDTTIAATDPMEFVEDEGLQKGVRVVLASNLSEHLTSTHCIEEDCGIVVQVWPRGVNSGTVGTAFYFFRDPFPVAARISSSTQNGSNKQWVYSCKEQYKAHRAYTGGTGSWAEKPLTGKTFTAYNLNEANNTSSGTYGNGVDDANLTGTFTVQAVPDDTVVFLRPRYLTAEVNGGTPGVEWWFEVPNGIDGEC